MSAKPKSWPSWLRKHGERLSSAVLGPHLDLLQERGERVPHMGWVVKWRESYFTGKVGWWDGERPVFGTIEQAKVYQSRAAACTAVRRIRERDAQNGEKTSALTYTVAAVVLVELAGERP